MLCGIDEAGRGPLAGPVYAAAVILYKDFPIILLNDSKKLKESHRLHAREVIFKKALFWGIGSCSHEEIDKINILQASLLAMKRAFEDLRKRAGSTSNEVPRGTLDASVKVIVDGKFTPDIDVPCKALVKADAQIPEVMAASILAKTERDIFMEEMAKLYPQYGYEKHKGYPTKAHREAVFKYGPSPIQRLSFKVSKTGI